jgi:predicted extracellular nuclease
MQQLYFFIARRLFLYSISLFVAVGTTFGQVVISEVYGGGGNAGATYKNDFIELFNRGNAPVNLTGWSVQYASSTGTSWAVTTLSGTLQPGQYYLVQQSAGTGGTLDLPAPDATGNIALSATSGKVALVNSATALTGVCPTVGVEDLVGFGTAATCFEGAGPTATLSNTTAAIRGGGGCTDTQNNNSDFTAGAPTPQNTASPLNVCGASGITITNNATLPIGVIGQPYAVTISVSGGTPPYMFSILSGTLPAGISLNAATGVLSGTTTQSGTFNFTIQVTDGANGTATKSFSLIITLPLSCTPTHTIAQIQGSGITSAMAGRTAITSGIITGVRSNGFFMQMPVGDGDVTTSDGIFVFTSTSLSAAITGNAVCVTGTVTEFIPSTDPNSPSQTEITSPTVFLLSTGNPLPPPVVITATDTDPSNLYNLEKYEGMRVQVTSLTVVAPTGGSISEANATSTSNGIFYGVVTGVPRPFREPGIALPDPLPVGAPCCVTRWDANPEIIAVASRGLTGGAAIDVATGAVVSNLVGVLDYTSRHYTIDVDVTTRPLITNNNLTFTAVPLPDNTEFTVASFNMERFYDIFNDPGSDVVLSLAALGTRLSKVSLTIRNVLHYPDILGVEEAENLLMLQLIAARVNHDAVANGEPNPNYQPYLQEGNDPGGIDVGFLVKASRVNVIDVTQFGKATTFINPADNQPDLLNDRPPLFLRATINGGAAPFPVTVIVNHLRSLNGVDDPVDGPRIRAKRKAQAEYLAAIINAFHESYPNGNIIAIGDFNAFQFSDGYGDVIGIIKGTPVPANEVLTPHVTTTNSPLTNLVETLPPNQRYTYVFDGSAQVLDHILINQNLLDELSRFHIARLDADFPEIYRSDPNRPERISDHDIPVAYFRLPSVLNNTLTKAAGKHQEWEQEFTVITAPNPSSSQFKVTLGGKDYNKKVALKIYDNIGRVVEVKYNLAIGQNFTLGSNYKPGVYFIEAAQGENRKMVRIVKL